jgi:hypothetical protein
MASAVDTTGFGQLTPAERMRRIFNHAMGDSTSNEGESEKADSSDISRVQTAKIPADSSQTSAKDTLAEAKTNQHAPKGDNPATAEKANQDSVRQAIMQAAIETRFLLAELYAYELHRPDSALEEYLLIAHEYPQSQYAPKALLAAAQIKYADHDSAGGTELLTSLLDKYPQSPQADQASRTLNSPVDPLNAIELYATAERLVFSEDNPDSALVLYRYIASKFPDLSAKAAFAAAWTLDNIIGTEDSSAYYAYSEITKKYPRTEYAIAASARIAAPTKRSERQSSQSHEQNPADSTNGESAPDSSSELVMGLPFAPPVTRPGVFIYPEALLSQELRGKVIFKIKLDFSGRVEDYQLIGPFGEHLIDSTATATLLQTEFDVSSLDLSQLDGYFQYSISFERPDINIYNDIYREQHERGP